jgi:flagellar hook-basal body complex protein FliE
MSLISPTTALGARPFIPPSADMLQRAGNLKTGALLDSAGAAGLAGAPGATPVKFDSVMDRALNAVEDAQAASAEKTRSVLLGDNGRLHESMIAMQEASLSFSLMIEVRNKVVESYQELMRLQV